MIKRAACISRRIWVNRKKKILCHIKWYFVLIPGAKLGLFGGIEKHSSV